MKMHENTCHDVNSVCYYIIIHNIVSNYSQLSFSFQDITLIC